MKYEFIDLKIGFAKKPYTREELKEAFDKVKAKTHWKDPIKSWCLAKDKDVIYEAVIYYTATVPEFSSFRTLNKRWRGFNVGDEICFVTADGYRLGPAGDH